MDIGHERYFPKHRIEKDIGLAEYNLAASRLTTEDQAVTWSTNATVLISTVVSYVAFKASEYSPDLQSAGLTENSFRAIVLAAIIFFCFITIVHVSNILKSRVFAERKVIVLRRILGVSYGENTLVLPNWRVEGADNPFSIHLFPGFLSYRSFPIHVVLLATCLSIFLLAKPLLIVVSSVIPQVFLSTSQTLIMVTVICYALGLFTFKVQLMESNETFFLWAARFAAFLLRVPLVANFENAIYRVRLDIAEAERIHSSFSNVEDIAVFVEDAQFFKHRGISWRGYGRAILGKLQGRNLGGGSTITQQFARSNFITRLRPTIGRKIVEFFLAKWVESILPKKEILRGYLVTARFDLGVYGFHRAYRYFFQDRAVTIDRWEAFILIERLGNVQGKFLGRRIAQILESALKEEMMSTEDIVLALKYYEKFVGHHFKLASNDLTPEEVLKRMKLPSVATTVKTAHTSTTDLMTNP